MSRLRRPYVRRGWLASRWRQFGPGAVRTKRHQDKGKVITMPEPVRRRSQQAAPRPKTVQFSLTEEEFAEISAAADRLALARGACAGEVVLAAARGAPPSALSPLREALAELMTAACVVRRAGTNLNQAVAKLNATGQAGADLVPAADFCARVIRRWTRRRSTCGGLSRDRTGRAPVIGKVIRGADVRRLLYYLYGPGRANEHVDPHLVAGFGDPAELEPERLPDGTADVRRLAGLLNQPLAALKGPGYDKPVWHCALRAAPGDRELTDDEWAQVASQVIDRTGLAPAGDELGVRWVAVRHAADHVHLSGDARAPGRDATADLERLLPGPRSLPRRPRNSSG